MICRHDPRATPIQHGSYLCPECGMIVTAGMEHPQRHGHTNYAPIDEMNYDQRRHAE